MTEDELVELVGGFEGVDVVVASEEGGAPEGSWGDVFFMLGDQMVATIVKRDQPGFDEASKLDRDGVFRLNIGIGRAAAKARFPAGPDPDLDPASPDHLSPHHAYAGAGWVSVVNPGSATDAEVRVLLHDAYERARAKTTQA